MATTTSSSTIPTSTDSSANSGSNGPSSPLLFFVALGFGVVFTNLWIIVGVKYCFRYNRRNRARAAGEDADGVDLNAMPRQRRRREKKLMTIDEVNERFPLVKYKTWRTRRADQGLPTAGGILNASSRPASVRNQARKSQDVESREIEPKTPTTSTINEKSSILEHGTPEQIEEAPQATTSSEETNANKSGITAPAAALVRQATADDEAEAEADTEEGDRIQTAIPAEQLPDPGDTCAICIDTIDEDDDIRGLSCGHAFHASCVDPWLTSRRACCPLCKADYYVPKPRPEGAQEDSRRSGLDHLPSGPFAIIGRPNQRRNQRNMLLPGVFIGSPHRGRDTNNGGRRSERRSQAASVPTETTTPEITSEEPSRSRWRPSLPNVRMPTMPALSRIRRGRGNDTGEQPNDVSAPTPAQLESGRS